MACATLLSRGILSENEASTWAFNHEFDAVINAVTIFGERVRNSFVRLLCDNTVVV